jgi:DNA polymerase beta thumb
VVPYSEFACACLYFTGSAHFNRSMRNLAARMNMSLNEHALYSGVVRMVSFFFILIATHAHTFVLKPFYPVVQNTLLLLVELDERVTQKL